MTTGSGSHSDRTSKQPETPCRPILNRQKCLFSNMENRKIKQILPGGWYHWEGGGYKKRV
jgi:hypothetical protein